MASEDGPGTHSPASEERTSIASHGLACQALFTKCVEASEPSKSSPNLQAHSRRYDLWATNIAAHHDATLPSSLEYRIRDDEHACNIVKRALSYLEESLELTLSILTGKKENEKWDSTSEFEELDLAVQEGITNLFELSMIIRKRPEKDEYIKASQATSFDPTPDIVHVGDKYPLTRDSNVWLKERLGTAITRRRQYLRYRKDHQEKMEQIHEMKKNTDGKTMWSGEKASTYLQESIFGKVPLNAPGPPGMSAIGAGNRPQTEYADSSRGKDGALDLLRTPRLPKDSGGVRVEYGQHFECPYCRRPQIVRDKNEWKKHIFRDLRPYVCTFKGCGLNMFESQNQWFHHELRFHRELWRCEFCDETDPQSRPDLELHIRDSHTDLVEETSMESLLNTCAITRIDATCCPLCTAYGTRLQSINQSSKCDVSLKQFQEHLGRHMEQLALAALPEEDSDEDEIQSDEEEDSSPFRSPWFPETSDNEPIRDSQAAKAKFNRLTETMSIASRAPTWGTRRRSQSSITADMQKDGVGAENPLKKLSIKQQPEKKPGFLNTLFRRNKGDTSDDGNFKRGNAQDFPEIPGEEHRNRSSQKIPGRKDIGYNLDFGDENMTIEENVEARRDADLRDPPGNDEQPERIIVQERHRRRSPIRSDSDEVVVIEEHIPPRRRKRDPREEERSRIMADTSDDEALHYERGSASRRSSISTVLSRASNILQIAYIPRVTDKNQQKDSTTPSKSTAPVTEPLSSSSPSPSQSWYRVKPLPSLPPNEVSKAADLWIPQATKDGRLFYFNTETGESRFELESLSSTIKTSRESGNEQEDLRFSKEKRPPSPLRNQSKFSEVLPSEPEYKVTQPIRPPNLERHERSDSDD